MRLAGLVLFAGCRIGFDPLTDASAVGTGDSAPTRIDTFAGTFLSMIEAESGVVTTPFAIMTVIPETFVVDGNTVGTTGPGSIGFTVVIPTAGTYYVWARVLAPDSTTDSFFIEFGGTGAGLFVTSECVFLGRLALGSSSRRHMSVVKRTARFCPGPWRQLPRSHVERGRLQGGSPDRHRRSSVGRDGLRPACGCTRGSESDHDSSAARSGGSGASPVTVPPSGCGSEIRAACSAWRGSTKSSASSGVRPTSQYLMNASSPCV